VLRVGALLVVASLAAAQQPAPKLAAYRGRIIGVYDLNTGAPIEGVEVLDVASGTKALTTATGTVSLAYLPDGGSTVRIRKLGYTPITQFIAVSPTDTVPLTLLLTPNVTVLPAVVTKDSAPHYISPGLRAFEERRKAGFGRFVTEDELRKSDTREMPDVLRSVPGVTIGCNTRTPRVCTAGSFRGGRGQGCPYLIYVDGIRMTNLNLLMLPVSQFAGVEVYSAATIPPMYNMTGTACGVLLFWSRER
jgi:hypothetical protein